MKRRTFLQTGLALTLASPLCAALKQGQLDKAADALAKAASSGQVHAASLHVRQGDREFSRVFGAAKSLDDSFLLASITKTMTAAALMTLYDDGEFALDDKVKKFIPAFNGDGRDKATIRHLLTHVSGLPDQLPQNAALRASHAELAEFVDGAIDTPLLFSPGARYQYSSMGILLATEIAQRISNRRIADLVDESICKPLEMKRSALGVGRLKLENLMRCQVESAAPESGAGDPAAKDWDWNSEYWRKLGVPWGGAHGSAKDVARFLSEFLHPTGAALKESTAKMMVKNHNGPGIHPRGLGFNVGAKSAAPQCSEQSFGHTGSTGTICWADPRSDTTCVVLTTLPARAANPHPRDQASHRVAQAAE